MLIIKKEIMIKVFFPPLTLIEKYLIESFHTAIFSYIKLSADNLF